jgi:hypothetical protein
MAGEYKKWQKEYNYAEVLLLNGTQLIRYWLKVK